MKSDRRWRRAGVLAAVSLCVAGAGFLPHRVDTWIGSGHAALVVQKGGDRTGAQTVAGPPGRVFDLIADASGDPPSGNTTTAGFSAALDIATSAVTNAGPHNPLSTGLDIGLLPRTFTNEDTGVLPPPTSKPALPRADNIFGPLAGIGVGVFLLGLALFIAAFKWHRLTGD